ncbi:hypothetical protein RFH95_06065 [Acinetobacter nosocomialis]|uniref:hypothetical protein n=1 Tax=Acinetobacter nosocomialis TaxID=106654 RepID=UPI000B3D8AB1|nr:hypothetical protein [Acinetobacter nosocomialis]MBD0445443.1 hypothetical protein [Acinetobacter nosocomialis]MDQ9039994.1 hypothetical protein [Acinetobacter nosocomialis]MDR9530987.1 hypothetical protein [Acinetobacter nosocomialis]OUT25606.1 hypothetical protein H125_15867 [Acinetobacter nosocomialis P020]PSE16191.1 hypothetical protein C7G95_06625 [Acinetobacter nosocomialis]
MNSNEEQNFYCSKLLEVMEELIKQNNTLIQKAEKKDTLIYAAIEQNNKLLQQYVENNKVDENVIAYLDSKPKEN